VKGREDDDEVPALYFNSEGKRSGFLSLKIVRTSRRNKRGKRIGHVSNSQSARKRGGKRKKEKVLP